MVFQYYLVYFIVNIVCFAFAITIFSRLSSNTGSGIETKLFRSMLIMYMAFLTCEIIWVLGTGGFLPISPYVGAVIKLAGTAFIPVKVYLWLQYAEIRFGNPVAYTRKFRLITAIPVTLMLIVYLSNPATGIVGTAMADGSIQPGPLIALTGIVDNIYGIAVVVHAIILIIKNKDKGMRRIYITHILFIVICTIGGIADAVISGTPIMPLAIMLSYTILFINLQESKIMNDSLTGLNNRRRADSYIREILSETDEDKPFSLFMIDIDNFSSISDNFGYVEGEKALSTVSDAIRKTAENWNGFSAKWSDDVFMVIIRTGSADEIREFRDTLSRTLEKASAANPLDYEIKVSIGREICDDSSRTPEDIINAAEVKLLNVKSSKGFDV